MKNNFQKIKKAHVIMCLFLVSIISCKQEKATSYSKLDNRALVAKVQEYYSKHLDSCISDLEEINAVDEASEKLKKYKLARKEFKLIEPILAFVDKENYKSLNAPNILKVEEEDATDIKIRNPFGFQVIEELLYEDKVDTIEVDNIVKATTNRLKLIAENNTLYLKKHHILWLLRDQITRIALVGITGFDSPVLEQSLIEAKTNYETLLFIIDVYKKEFSKDNLYVDFVNELQMAQKVLQKDNFESFNRYNFIKNYAHKQLELLVKTSEDWKVEFPLTMAFNNNITSLFSKETFNVDFFNDYHQLEKAMSNEKIALGRKLFNDKNLSKDGVMSCATCHIKDKAFTDGLATFPKQKRNTPTLLYAAYQQTFFHDGRAGSLEGQIVGVVENKNEFHTSLEYLTETVKNDSVYTKSFTDLYGKITDFNIRNAIANYIRSLGDFNSKFDKNINNKENNLTTSEVNGFNLFMGKAKCATCHFPPVFNGTVPPNFTETEVESIGVPNMKETELDDDLGAYDIFKTEERKYFFKTSTVRNISKTAPYMHNGVYETLEQVIDFYNKGGGEGLGYEVPNQTLPSDKLNLSEKEIEDLIAFMESLTDE
ncbi:methylamine utilization protein [Tenacibaculum sp. 1B UA]|uniref:cytochrome-c peroxidase n=1 Tax=Tenacibaculum sp. 1B UA TaxID=2922252 RepID=UPI002A24C931|nr:cytochrome c peroxidase [Tenacibaculum sp. 1B UA]MDX8553284.1 methylamine utilization protein [Tenacibaculum sp. 1B UA]